MSVLSARHITSTYLKAPRRWDFAYTRRETIESCTHLKATLMRSGLACTSLTLINDVCTRKFLFACTAAQSTLSMSTIQMGLCSSSRQALDIVRLLLNLC